MWGFCIVSERDSIGESVDAVCIIIVIRVVSMNAVNDVPRTARSQTQVHTRTIGVRSVDPGQYTHAGHDGFLQE